MPENKWTVLTVTTVGSFMSSLDSSIMNIAIPALSAELGASFEIAQWIPIIYLLMMAVTLIGFGRLSDLKGRKNFYLFGIVLFTSASLFSATTLSAEFLIIFRGIQGVGASLITANAISMITEVFPPRETGKALGINVASIYFGLVLGPVLGGILVNFFTWRSIFFINIPIGIAITIIGFIKLEKKEAVSKGESFDYMGTFFFGIFLATLLLAFTFAKTWGTFSVAFFIPFLIGNLMLFPVYIEQVIVTLLIISLASLGVFLIVEHRVKYPMINPALFRKNRVFAAANTAALLNYVALMGVSFLLSIYLQSILGIPAMIAGFILVPTTILMAVVSPLSGRLSDKVGTRVLCSVGMGLMAVAMLIVILTISINPIISIIAGEICLGLGIGLFSSPNQSAIMKSVEKKELGIASGTLSTMRVTGQSVSVALLSLVLGFFIPPVLLNPIISKQVTNISIEMSSLFVMGMQAAFILSMMICIAGSIVSLVRGKESRVKKEK
ncbi:MAG: MFS transporter [Candidatus Helarchaeota archaeon]